MLELIKNASVSTWEFRIAIGWFILFSVNSLCTAMMSALTGAQWNQLDTQSKFMIFLMVTLNWTGTIMAFISKQSQNLKKTGTFTLGDETAFVNKKEVKKEVDNAIASTPTITPK